MVPYILLRPNLLTLAMRLCDAVMRCAYAMRLCEALYDAPMRSDYAMRLCDASMRGVMRCVYSMGKCAHGVTFTPGSRRSCGTSPWGGYSPRRSSGSIASGCYTVPEDVIGFMYSRHKADEISYLRSIAWNIYIHMDLLEPTM